MFRDDVLHPVRSRVSDPFEFVNAERLLHRGDIGQIFLVLPFDYRTGPEPEKLRVVSLLLLQINAERAVLLVLDLMKPVDRPRGVVRDLGEPSNDPLQDRTEFGQRGASSRR